MQRQQLSGETFDLHLKLDVPHCVVGDLIANQAEASVPALCA